MSTSIDATQSTQGVHPEPAAASHQQPSASEITVSEQPAASPKFSSPFIKVDNDTGLALYIVRDTETGVVESQYPSKQVVAEYGRVQGGSSASGQTAPSGNNDGAASESTQSGLSSVYT